MSGAKPIRILHVLGGMHRGGVETWLMHVLRNIDRERFAMDFLVHTREPCAYDAEILSLGSRVIPCLHPSRPLTYARGFRRILRKHGPYDVLHSHVHHYSGYVLLLGRRAGVPLRIAHSHSDTSSLSANSGLLRRGYLALSRSWIRRHATLGLACSALAGKDLFGSTWGCDPRWRTLYCGIDPGLFRSAPKAIEVRAELRIPEDAFVVGHVGRFYESKNHMFLVAIAQEIARRLSRARFLLVGDGPLRPAIERLVAAAGLTDRFVFTGIRPDVPRLMLGAMDAFVLPSTHEGLPLVALEAQAAGLPFVCSDGITREIDVVPGLIRRVPLSQPASVWADRVCEVERSSASDSLRVFEGSPFNIAASVRALEGLYA